jgi:flagellar hook-associated protein 2
MALDVSTQMRLTGMASGLDTDAIIQNLGKVHTLRINKVKQDKQIAVWKQEMYRDTITKLSNFMKSNLNLANPTSNFRSASAFAKFSYNLTMKGNSTLDASKLMSVTANGDLRNFNQAVQGVAQLATKDTWAGDKMGLLGITTSGFNFENFGVVDLGDGDIGLKDPKYAIFGVSIDGTSRTVSIAPEKILDMFGDGMDYKVEYGKGSRKIAGSEYTGAIELVAFGEMDASEKPIYMRDDANGTYKLIDISDLNKVIEDEFGAGTTFDADNADHRNAIRQHFGNAGIYGEPGAKDALVDDFAAGNFGNPADPYYVNDNGTYREVDDNLLNSIVSGTYDDTNPAHKMAVEDYFSDKAIFKANDDIKDPKQAFADLINSEIVTQFGPNYSNIVSVTAAGELNFQKSGSTVTLFEVTGFATLENMGLAGGASTSGAVNNRKVSDLPGLSGLFSGVNEATIKINGVNIKLSKDDTVKNLMDKINGSDAGVTLSYTASTDSFTLTSKLEGSANNIAASGLNAEAVALFGALKIDMTETGFAGHEGAKNLIAVINGEEYIRQSNTFTHEGMTFTFNETFNATLDSNGKATVTDNTVSIKVDVTKNTADIVTSIKGFVEEYNKLVEHINDLLNGKRDRDYKPLTDDEKKAMSKEEVELYESKTKIGLLANDSDLRKLLNEMRSSIYQKVEGVGLTMSDIGITTSANWKDGGLLVIDENKLSAAIEKNYDGVVSLFTQSSKYTAWDKEHKSERYAESGIAQRLNDILNAAAGTTATSGVSGDKGYLLQKAGMLKDTTETDNVLTKQINEYDKKIDQLLDKWYRQENAYYMMFARMETMMSKLQAQQNSLAQIMAQGGK